jgi:hypothetical protein
MQRQNRIIRWNRFESNTFRQSRDVELGEGLLRMPSVRRIFIGINILYNPQFLVVFGRNDADLVVCIDLPAFVDTSTPFGIIHRVNMKSTGRRLSGQFAQFLTEDLLKFQCETSLITEEDNPALRNYTPCYLRSRVGEVLVIAKSRRRVSALREVIKSTSCTSGNSRPIAGVESNC